MPDYLLASGLPSYPSGLSDKDAALVLPLYRAINALAQQLSVVAGAVQYSSAEQAQVSQLSKLTSTANQKLTVKAGEALAYGQLLTLSVVSGKIVAMKADASTLTKPAHAVCDTPGGIALNAFGDAVFMTGLTAGISGTVLGAAYYLSTAGTIQISPTVATGVLNQVVGIGLGSAGFYLDIEPIGKRVSYAYKFSAAVLRVLYTDGSYADLAV